MLLSEIIRQTKGKKAILEKKKLRRSRVIPVVDDSHSTMFLDAGTSLRQVFIRLAFFYVCWGNPGYLCRPCVNPRGTLFLHFVNRKTMTTYCLCQNVVRFSVTTRGI